MMNGDEVMSDDEATWTLPPTDVPRARHGGRRDRATRTMGDMTQRRDAVKPGRARRKFEQRAIKRAESAEMIRSHVVSFESFD